MDFRGTAKSTMKFSYGTDGNAYGKKMGKTIAKEVGIVSPENAKFKDVFKAQTWKNAAENAGKLKNGLKSTSLYNNPGSFIKEQYIETHLKSAEEAAENAVKKAAKKPGFFVKMFRGAKNIVSKIPGATKVAKCLKKVPLVGPLLIAAGELPDVIDSFSKGFGEGLKQLGRSAINLTASMGAFVGGSAAGAAIGQVLIPIPGVGAAIGFIVGMGASMLADQMIRPITNDIFGKAPSDQEEVTQNEGKLIQQYQQPQQSQQLIDPYNYTSQGSYDQTPSVNTTKYPSIMEFRQQNQQPLGPTLLEVYQNRIQNQGLIG